MSIINFIIFGAIFFLKMIGLGVAVMFTATVMVVAPLFAVYLIIKLVTTLYYSRVPNEYKNIDYTPPKPVDWSATTFITPTEALERMNATEK